MTSVRSYSIEKERAIKEIRAGIEERKAGFPEVEERMAAGVNEIQAERCR